MLEEQDAELNSTTVSGNTTCAQKEPDVSVAAQAVASESRAASAQQELRSSNRAHRCLHSAAGTPAQEETMQQLNSSLHINCTEAAYNAAQQSCRDRMCRIIQSMQKRNSIAMVRYDRNGRRKGGRGENTDKGRKTAQEILS